MTALSADRITPERKHFLLSLGVAAGAVIYSGALVAMDTDGYLVPAGTAVTETVLGRANDFRDNTGGADGDLECEVAVGVFQWENSAAADEILSSDRGKACYAVDDQTVALTDNNAARALAGMVVSVDSDGVWVATGETATDYDRRMTVQLEAAIESDGTYRYVHAGPAATIQRISTVITTVAAASTTAAQDVVLTPDIDTVAITGGVVTIAGGSADATVDTAVPTALNVISEGEVLTIAVESNAQVVVGVAAITVELTY